MAERTTDAHGGEATGEPAARRPARGTRDMVISLLVLMLPVLVLFGLFRWVTGGDDPAPVDQEPAVTAARSAGLAAAAPVGLDDGWVPVTAVFQPGDGELTLRLGYLTPAGESVQLVQSTRPVEPLLAAELGPQARPGGEAGLETGVWRTYVEVRGGAERALVRLEPDRTTVVVGGSSEAELRALAAATP